MHPGLQRLVGSDCATSDRISRERVQSEILTSDTADGRGSTHLRPAPQRAHHGAGQPGRALCTPGCRWAHRGCPGLCWEGFARLRASLRRPESLRGGGGSRRRAKRRAVSWTWGCERRLRITLRRDRARQKGGAEGKATDYGHACMAHTCTRTY